MEENTGNTENKKTKVMIIGHVDHGKTTLTAALMQAMEVMEVKERGIIIVEAKDELPTISAKMKESEDPFDNTPKFVIRNYREIEPLQEPFIDYSINNPWPPPKGRKGKRRW